MLMIVLCRNSNKQTVKLNQTEHKRLLIRKRARTRALNTSVGSIDRRKLENDDRRYTHNTINISLLGLFLGVVNVSRLTLQNAQHTCCSACASAFLLSSSSL